MSFVTGLMLIDAPASALNNSGSRPDQLFGNKVAVKAIRHGGSTYPYVSAQAFRYWLRTTLERTNIGWQNAPIYREEKVAYTDANPIKWWDDDLFGYMRSPKTGKAAKNRRKEDPEYEKMTPLETAGKNDDEQTVTRASPFRVSTLVSNAPAQIVEDWESMSRLEGDPVPYSSQFYRATLQGLFSLDLHASGTFSYRNRTGYRNLDSVRREQAQKESLEHLESEKSYRLPLAERIKRVGALFEGLANLEGGANQTLHYTDVSPALIVLAVTKGGNHIFGHVIGTDHQPKLKIKALHETMTVFKGDILSTIYVGWVQGYLDKQREELENALAEGGQLEQDKARIILDHPRIVLSKFIEDLKKPENNYWLD